MSLRAWFFLKADLVGWCLLMRRIASREVVNEYCRSGPPDPLKFKVDSRGKSACQKRWRVDTPRGGKAAQFWGKLL
jgi:hypothetical protein